MIYKFCILRYAATGAFNSACLQYATYLPEISTKKPMMNLWFTYQLHNKLSWMVLQSYTCDSYKTSNINDEIQLSSVIPMDWINQVTTTM